MPDSQYHCDVAVLGGGPAGVAAASVAAQRGSRVVLLESTPWLGGPIWRATERRSVPRMGRRWLQRLEKSGAEVLTETSAFGQLSQRVTEKDPRVARRLFAQRHTESLEIRCRRLVLATGAQELFLPFPGWTLPNVFGVGGLQLLAKSGWPVRGKRIVVAGSGPLLFAVAAALKQRGAHVTDILEQAPRARVMTFALTLPRLAPGKVFQALGLQRTLIGVRYRAGCWPVAAHGTDVVQGVTFTNGHKVWRRECDFLACGFGLVPNSQWPRLLGCTIRHDAVEVDCWQQTSVPGVYTAGEATGVSGVEAALIEGQIAGYAASGGDTQADARKLFAAREKSQRFAAALQATFRLRRELMQLVQDDTIVCRCEDVTWGQIKEYQQLRAAKLHSRCGMGPCQGRVCHNALRLLKSWQPDRMRPPVLPTTVGAIAGISDGTYDDEF